MDTCFAPAERAEESELKKQINFISQSPIIDGLLKTVGGMLVILNENRQILAVNEGFIKTIGANDIENLLGLRPGEAISCIYHKDMPGGCGTGRYCSTCGVAIAIVLCMEDNLTVEKVCPVKIKKNNQMEDIFLKVNATTVTIDSQRFVLLFLQDFSNQQEWAAIEKVFFHDIGNIINGLAGITKILDLHDRRIDDQLINQLKILSARLTQEIEMQKALSHTMKGTYQLDLQEVSLEKIFIEIQAVIMHHPSSAGKQLTISNVLHQKIIIVDIPLLMRILINMLLNAFEATDNGGEVRLWTEKEDEAIIFNVWNETPIPKNVALRIFQRNFTTKEESGRGYGTYSMKLFGEKFLNGKVDFTTSETDGTIFRIKIPIQNSVSQDPKKEIPSSLRLLLVEDEPFNLELARILLEREGHKVFQAENGLEAIHVLAQTDIDAILMDDKMPVMDGVAAARLIRDCDNGIIPDENEYKNILGELTRKVKGGHIPMFALTANATPDNREKYRQAGLDDYFSKPFEPKDIALKVYRINSSSEK